MPSATKVRIKKVVKTETLLCAKKAAESRRRERKLFCVDKSSPELLGENGKNPRGDVGSGRISLNPALDGSLIVVVV